MRTIRHALFVAVAAALVPAAGRAQEPVVPDSVAGDSLARAQAVRDSALTPEDPNAPGNCTLEFEPIDPRTRSLSQRDQGEAYITYISGRMLWTCGNATMEADSAVKYDVARRVNLSGNVIYRDSIRELTSDLLTYYEIQDLVVAERDVELVRTTDGSTLTGPHVEFLRAVSGVDEVTTATGRPHMTFYPASDSTTEAEPVEPDSVTAGEPFEIDADRAQFAGESVARMYGEVLILRSDLHAEADSAVLTREDGVGTLWGDPWVESEDVRLEGDTIRFVSEEEELREVHALGHGFARGEQFEVRSDLIDIALVAREVDEVWAYGEGGSEALSGDHRLYGDSLRFRMYRSQVDTVFSVGEAIAIQGESGAPPPRDLLEAGPGDSTGVAADSAGIAGDSAGIAADSAGLVADSAGLVADSAGVVPDSAAARADTLPRIAVPDSLRPAGDSIARAAALADSVRAGLPDSLRDLRLPSPSIDSTGVVGADSTARELMATILENVRVRGPDSAAAGGGEAGTGAAEASSAPGPRLAIDGSMNWVRGDTLVAVFEREGRQEAADSAAAALADSLGFAPDAAGADSVAAEADSLAAPPPEGDETDVTGPGEAPEAAQDTTADPRMERMTVIGSAKAFYRQVRDSTATDRPSRNYMIGKRIDLFFEEGEVAFVRGVNAIGAFLEPEEAVPAGAGGTAGRAGPVVGDSAAVRDSLGVRADSLVRPPDSLSVPPDSAGARPDSSSLPPDSVGAPPDPAGGSTGAGSIAGPARATLSGRDRRPYEPAERVGPGGRVWRKR